MISKRLYGRSSEKQDRPGSKRPRGQQRGAPGHGRTARPGLGQRLEVRQPPAGECVCSRCGMPYVSNGEHCTEIVEIDVRAYKRRVVRPRRRRGCGCGDSPREVAAAPVQRLFARTPYGITVWASTVMERYVCHRPLNGVAAWLGYQGLTISPGTLAGGLGRMEAWFEPLAQAILDHQNSAPVRHGDETGWRVQELRRDGRSARAWLWVSVTPDAVYYHVDATRSAAAALVVFGEVKVEQVLVVDRYASYKKLARLLDGRVILAWCWAYVAHPIMLRSSGLVAPDVMNSLFLRNIICGTHSVPRKAIKPLFAFHGRSGPGCAASQSAIALAFISISISA